MLDAFSKRVLNRRPNIQFVSPRSVDTVPDPSPATPSLEVPERVQQLITGFENLDKAAEAAENLIAERAKEVTLQLNLDDPQDFSVAQAAARLFPDAAKEIEGLPGVRVVKEITFDMYRACTQDLKNHGKTAGQRNQIPAVNPGAKTDFGGVTKDRRPELNAMSVIIPPVPIPAYLIATIPLLFLMLHPLRMLYTNTKVVGHIHNVITPVPGTPVGPGIPVNPA